MGEQKTGEGGGVWEEIQGYSHGSMSHGRGDLFVGYLLGMCVCLSIPTWSAVETQWILGHKCVLPTPPSPIHLSIHTSTHSLFRELTLHSRSLAKHKEVNNKILKVFKIKLLPHQTCSFLLWNSIPPSMGFSQLESSACSLKPCPPPRLPPQLSFFLSVHFTSHHP